MHHSPHFSPTHRRAVRAAGYRWGDTPLPSPPATKSLRDFQGGGATDGAAIAALVAWANAQPEAAGWVVLELPEGNFTLDRAITLTRSQTILRGAGRDRTELYLPSSLADLQGARRRAATASPAACAAPHACTPARPHVAAAQRLLITPPPRPGFLCVQSTGRAPAWARTNSISSLAAR